mmetsp:Transcript_57238/g.167517  ORF Transcript_57238/g.167517 Transcript_57238/m.167517 type:complete len:392 (-) Transcript_57238:196-1371(-)
MNIPNLQGAWFPLRALLGSLGAYSKEPYCRVELLACRPSSSQERRLPRALSHRSPARRKQGHRGAHDEGERHSETGGRRHVASCGPGRDQPHGLVGGGGRRRSQLGPQLLTGVDRREAHGVAAQHAALQSLVEVVERRHGPVALRLAQHLVDTSAELQPACAAPVGPPTVADDPVLDPRRRLAPAGHFHDVVDLVLREDLVGDVHSVVQLHIRAVVEHERFVCGERTCYGPASVDLLHHRNFAGKVAVGAYPIAGPILHCEAPLGSREAVAADCILRATHVRCLVRHARLVRHLVLLHVLVDHPRVTAVAARRRSTVCSGYAIVDYLAPKHHIWKFSTTHNLDPIVERRGCAMDPASPTVYWDVLVPVGSDQVSAIDAAPVKLLWQSNFSN